MVKTVSKTRKKASYTKEKSNKKRGRYHGKIIDNAEDIIHAQDTDNSNKGGDESAIITRINLPIGFIDAKKKIKEPAKIIPDDLNLFPNEFQKSNKCTKCLKNDKIIKQLKQRLVHYGEIEGNNKSYKVYVNTPSFISFDSNKKITLKKTTQLCWWDCHPFDNFPFFLPENYHKGNYYVSGCFCSLNCAMAYNLFYVKDSKIYQRKSLILKLYREIFNVPEGETIQLCEASPRESLIAFGGKKTIVEFRNNFYVLSKQYSVLAYPLKPVNTYIEEKDSSVVKYDNEYNLKRSKPLIRKKNIIAALQNN
jgi:hypothetical protein